MSSRGGRPGTRAALGRSLRLGWIVARHLVRFGYGALRARLVRGGPGQARRGPALAALFEDLGPTFVKAGQVLASRPDLVGPDTAATLSRLRNRQAPVAFPHIAAALRAGLGRPLEDVFASIDEVSLGTGSVAQVHRAVLRDGRVVAVKVVKPGVAAQITSDFALLRRAAALAERLPAWGALPLVALVEQLEASLRMQVDLAVEAGHQAQLGQNIRERGVRIPQVVREHSTSTVLVMELMEGLTAVDSAGADSDGRRAAAVQGLGALYRMIFRDGLVHADLHPGNLFLSREGELVFLDCGLVAVLDDQAREHFRELFWSLASGDGWRCAHILLHTAQHRPAGLDEQGFVRAVEALVGRFFRQSVSSFEVAGFVTGLLDTQRRFGIRGSTEFVMTIYSLLVFEGVLKTLAPGLDFQREAAAYLLTVPRATGPADRSAVFAELEAEMALRRAAV